nr:hypothetical protein [Actinomadura sp. CNU-125]
MVDVDDPERDVGVVDGVVAAEGEGGRVRPDLADLHRAAVVGGPVEQPFQEPFVASRRRPRAEGRDGVGPFDLVDVVAHVVDPRFDEEVVVRLGVVEREVGQHRNGAEADASLLEEADSAHDVGVRAAPLPVDAHPVVDERGPVHADADADPVPPDELHPAVAHQRRVRLESVADVAAVPVGRLGGDRERVLVEAGRDRQRLAEVPEEGDRILDELAGQDAVEGRPLHLGGHARADAPFGEIAVGTVDVAERRGLQDHQRPVVEALRYGLLGHQFTACLFAACQ